MSPLCYLLVTVPITAPIKSTPHITKYPNQSNIYDRAQPGRDNGVCKFLGNTTSFDACSERCLKYKGPADELCHSFSWNDNKWMPTWAGMCFGITDHEWHLYDGGCTGDNTANVRWHPSLTRFVYLLHCGLAGCPSLMSSGCPMDALVGLYFVRKD